jgi:hypothetical protein
MRETHAVDDDSEEFDSPFARVPASDAGPGPMQDGYLTYERMIAATGQASAARTPRWVRLVLVFLLTVVVLGLIGSLILTRF